MNSSDRPGAGLEGLTNRQHDILRQIAHGRSAADVAFEGDIAVSTVEKHLAAIRDRLGVSRTTQAVALFWQDKQRRGSRRQEVQNDLVDGHAHPRLAALFLADLEGCQSFGEAWDGLCEHLASIGFSHAVLGVVAEPFGEVTTCANLLAASLPGHLEEFARLGNLPRNPIEQAMGKSRADQVFTPAVLSELTRRQFPEELSADALAMLVPGHPLFLFPELEPQSGAPVGLALMGDADHMRRLQSDGHALSAHVHGITRAFWEFAKPRGWLAQKTGLTARQTEALGLAARGMDASQVAWRLGISRSSAVKRLQGARMCLGAPNIAAAIYRGTVYGAFGHGVH